MHGIHQKGVRGKSNVLTKLRQKYKVKSLGCTLYIWYALSIEKYGTCYSEDQYITDIKQVLLLNRMSGANIFIICFLKVAVYECQVLLHELHYRVYDLHLTYVDGNIAFFLHFVVIMQMHPSAIHVSPKIFLDMSSVSTKFIPFFLS